MTRQEALAPRTGAEYARILGVGAYRPSRVVTNDEICEHIDSSDEWIRERSGIITRHFAADDESVVDMAAAAAEKALAGAGVSADQLDAVVVSTVTHLLQTPSAAAELSFRLGAGTPAAFDISAACAGFSYGLAIAQDLIRGGSATCVLLVGVEKLSDITDPTDRGTAFIFGDGAGAAVIGPSDTPAIGPVVWGSDGAQTEAIIQDVPWQVLRGDASHKFPTLRMNGQQVFRWAVYEMAKVAQEALDSRRDRGGRPRRLHPAPGEHADHRRHDQAARAAGLGRRGPRHRRDRQHLGSLHPVGDGPHARRGADQER